VMDGYDAAAWLHANHPDILVLGLNLTNDFFYERRFPPASRRYDSSIDSVD